MSFELFEKDYSSKLSKFVAGGVQFDRVVALVAHFFPS